MNGWNVSIIMPTLQRGDRILAAIDSVRAQTWPHWELVIIDSGSTDGTLELLEGIGDPRIKLHQIERGSTIAASRNLAISLSEGELLAFLDSDDVWFPEKLQVACQSREPGILTYHPLSILTPRGPEPGVVGRELPDGDTFRELLLRGNVVPNSSVVVDRRLVMDVGGLDERRDLMSVEDFDLWLRLARRNVPFRCHREALGSYWKDGRNISSRRHRARTHPLRPLFSVHLDFLDPVEREKGVRAMNRAVAMTGIGRIDDAKMLRCSRRERIGVAMSVLPLLRWKDGPRWTARVLDALLGPG